MLEVKRIVTGNLEENCYLIYQHEVALIVDPGDDFDKIKAEIDRLKVKPKAILLTHTHSDHIGALEETRETYQIPVYVSPEEQAWLGDAELNLSAFSGLPFTTRPAEFEFEMKEYDLDGFNFTVVPTPGHSPGGVSFIFDGFVISGDALFNGSIGRTDLYQGDLNTLLSGVREHLFSLPDEFRVYPGHLGDTTIGYEKRFNPFFQ